MELKSEYLNGNTTVKIYNDGTKIRTHVGTSLPELAVTISAAKKKKYGIVLGNVVGSNIFNSLCVIGIPTVLGSFYGKEYNKLFLNRIN